MANSSLLKGGVIVVVLLAALAVFDYYDNYSDSQSVVTGAAVSEGQSSLGKLLVSTGSSGVSVQLMLAGYTDEVQRIEAVTVATGDGRRGEVTLTLSEGTYNVLLNKSGYEPYATTVEVKGGQTKNLIAHQLMTDPPAAIYVTVFPDAEVYVDGVLMTLAGGLPFSGRVISLSVGEHTVRFSRSGYDDFVTRVSIKNRGDLVWVSTKLKETPKGSVELPDLSVVYLWGFLDGDVVRVGYEIGNDPVGADVKTPFNVKVWLQSGLNWPSKANLQDAELLESYSVPELKKQGSTYDAQTGKWKQHGRLEGRVEIEKSKLKCDPNYFTSNYGLILSVDSDSVIEEQSEGNNKVALGIPLVCSPLPQDEATRQVKQTLKKGWNLVAVNALNSVVSSENCEKLQGVVHAFYPQVKKDGAYGSYRLNSNLKGIAVGGATQDSALLRSSYPGVLSGAGAVWLYNKGAECAITSQIEPHTEPFPLAAGWNMVAVQPHWVGKKASEVMGSCSSGKSWTGFFYDAVAGWDIINPDTVFKQEDVGKGFWARISFDGYLFMGSISLKEGYCLYQAQLFKKMYQYP